MCFDTVVKQFVYKLRQLLPRFSLANIHTDSFEKLYQALKRVFDGKIKTSLLIQRPNTLSSA